MGFSQSRKRGGKKKGCSVFSESGLAVCTVFAHIRIFTGNFISKTKSTLTLMESTCFCYIGVARLELAASCSQSRRATNCATPRHPAAFLHRRSIVYRFLRGSSIQNPQLRARRVLLFSAGGGGSSRQRREKWREGSFLAQQPKR